MKRSGRMLFIVLLVGILSACGVNHNNTKKNQITVADRTEKENIILSTVANESFLFDFVNTDYEEVTLWVEKYESGKLVDERVAGIGTDIGEAGTIVVAVGDLIEGEHEQVFYLGIGDANGGASGRFLFPKPGGEIVTTYGGLTKEKTLTEEEMVLMTVAFSDDEFGVSSISNDFYEDPIAHHNELEKHHTVYVLKAAFMQ